MSPVHVIVGEDDRAEAMWAAAFTGAVDLYRFPRNVDAFERLTAAQAPIDLLVVTPAQRGPFNLSADQLVARLLEGALASDRNLANLHVIVVGQPLERTHPRVVAVSTLDAAIRLVKFGELEQAPRPVVAAPVVPVAREPRSGSRADVDAILSDPAFAGSIISRIWDAPDPAGAERAQLAAPAPEAGSAPTPAAAAPAPVPAPPVPVQQPAPQPVPAVVPAAPAAPQLFTRAAPAGFVVAPHAPVAAPMPAQAPEPVVGGGASGQPAAGCQPVPGESIQVASGPLQPSRPYQLPQGGGYRGPALRAGQVNPAHHVDGQPVPPALASQVQSMVYGGMVGNPADPLLTWSSGARAAAAPVPDAAAAPAPMAAPGAMLHPMPSAVPVAAQQHAQLVPLEPPPGVYAAAPAAVAAPASDPFLRRAEQRGGDVSFG